MTHPSPSPNPHPNPNPNASTDLSPVSAECTLPETFSVDDPTSANWVVRKIIEARNYAQHVKEWAEAECKRAQNEEQFFLFHYGIQLERWAKSEIDGSRRKCVKLPGGTVGFRTESRKLDGVLEAPKANDALTNTRTERIVMATIFMENIL